MTQLRAENTLSYFDDAVRLRIALTWNDADVRFASHEGNEITYFVDTDIASLFIDPNGKQKYVECFGTASLGDEGRRESTMAATAAVTAEYIFSKQLPGKRKGRVFLSPAHQIELDLVGAAILSRLRANTDALRDSQAADIKLTEAARSHLKSVLSRVKADNRTGSNIDVAQAISVLYVAMGELSEQISARLASVYMQAQSFLRLFSQLLIGRDLSSLEGFTSDVVDPNRRDVLEWTVRLVAAYLGEPFRPDRHSWETLKRLSASRVLRFRRDAETLVQILELNRLATEAERYLLITGSPILHRAFNQWYWERIDRPAKEFFVRDPLQYAPAFNFNEMANIDPNLSVFRKTVQTLDDLLQNFRVFCRRYPHDLARHFGYSPTRTPPYANLVPRLFQISESVRNELVGDWQKAESTSLAANLDLLQDRKIQLEQILGALLDEDRAVLLSLQEALLQDLEKRHVSVAINLSITRMVDKARNIEAAPEVIRANRQVLPITEDFSALIGDRDIYNFIQQDLIKDPVDTLRTLERKGTEVDVTLSRFFLASLAYHLGQWEDVIANVLLARNAPTQKDARRDHEMTYLKALASRLAARKLDELQNAELELRDAESQHKLDKEDSWHQAKTVRAMSERAAILLTVVLRWLVPDSRFGNVSQDVAIEAFETAIKLLLEAGDRLGDFSSENRTKDIVRCIEDQIQSNLCVAYVFSQVAPPPLRSIDLLSVVQRKVIEVSKAWLPPPISPFGAGYMSLVERGMARWFLAASEQERSLLKSQLFAVMGELENYWANSRGTGFTLYPEIDRVEIKLFESKLLSAADYSD